MAVPAPVDPTVGDRRVENLTTSLRRVERQKRSLEEWTGTLERTVSAHERVARDREAEQARLDAERVAEQARLEAERVAEQARLEAERVAEQARLDAEREAEQARLDAERAGHAAELRVRAQEMAAVEMRLDRTLRSQSFRLGHLLVRIAVAPVKALKWVARSVRRLLVRVYRLAQRTLPEPVVEPLQKVATSGQVATVRRQAATVRRQAATVRRQAARRYEVLDLAGDRPVAFVDGRGLTAVARDELWARVAASDQPARTIVLTDDVDFTGLRALGLSFEYLPPYRHGTPWWVDEADHARWVDDRLAAMRLGYGVEDPDGSPAVVLAAGSADG